MQLHLFDAPRLGQIGQGAGEARERHELFLAEDFSVLCGVHWRFGSTRRMRVAKRMRTEESSEAETLEGK